MPTLPASSSSSSYILLTAESRDQPRSTECNKYPDQPPLQRLPSKDIEYCHSLVVDAVKTNTAQPILVRQQIHALWGNRPARLCLRICACPAAARPPLHPEVVLPLRTLRPPRPDWAFSSHSRGCPASDERLQAAGPWQILSETITCREACSFVLGWRGCDELGCWATTQLVPDKQPRLIAPHRERIRLRYEFAGLHITVQLAPSRERVMYCAGEHIQARLTTSSQEALLTSSVSGAMT